MLDAAVTAMAPLLVSPLSRGGDDASSAVVPDSVVPSAKPASATLDAALPSNAEDDDEFVGSFRSGNADEAASQLPDDVQIEQICEYSDRLQPNSALAHLALFR